MSAGTIALTNKSVDVVGTGTSFTNDVTPNDVIVAVSGGTSYTLIVDSVQSDTALKLIQEFTGPDSTGLAWAAVPAKTMSRIQANMAGQVTYAMTGFNLDKTNWQQIFSGTGDVTVRLPDGSSFTGPAWRSIIDAVSGKANLVEDVVEVAHGGTGQKSLSGVMTWLGLGDAAFKNTGNTSGSLAAGNDARLMTINDNSGGTLTSPIIFSGAKGFKLDVQSTSTEVVNGEYRNYIINSVNSAGGNASIYQFSIPNQYTSCVIGIDSSIFQLRSNGIGYSPSGWQTYSDKRVKDKIEIIDNPIERLFKMRGYTYEKFGIPGTGVIAQEAEEAISQSVSVSGDMNRPDTGDLVKDALSISPGDLVGLLIEVCRSQEERLQKQEAAITELQARMKAVDGLDS